MIPGYYDEETKDALQEAKEKATDEQLPVLLKLEQDMGRQEELIKAMSGLKSLFDGLRGRKAEVEKRMKSGFDLMWKILN